MMYLETMYKRLWITTSIAFFQILSSFSQAPTKGVDTLENKEMDTASCIKNISLFVSYAKNNQYADAYPFWEKAFMECPSYRKSIYLYGVKIVRWKILSEKDPQKKQELIKKLFEIYDKRMHYFGDDVKYPSYWIRGNKAIDYINFKPEETSTIYNLLSQSVNEGKDAVDVEVLRCFVEYSAKMVEKDPSHRSVFINDYIKVSTLLDNRIANNVGDMQKNKTAKEKCNEVAMESGVFDCSSLQETFASDVEKNKGNQEVLERIIHLFSMGNCRNNALYFKASGYSHTLQPTTENSLGIAYSFLNKGDLTACEDYFEKAVDLSQSETEKVKILWEASNLMYEKRNYSKARKFLMKIASLQKGNGNPYLMIAKMYAKSAQSIYPEDKTLASCVYYAVVGKAEMAKNVDPSCEKEANELIRTYSAYFPSKQEIFMHGMKKGETFLIGGWIQESVVIR